MSVFSRNCRLSIESQIIMKTSNRNRVSDQGLLENSLLVDGQATDAHQWLVKVTLLRE